MKLKFWTISILIFSGDDLTSYVLTENEYKYNMGQGYVFFEVIEPEELSYTYKLNPAAFSVPWNKTYGLLFMFGLCFIFLYLYLIQC